MLLANGCPYGPKNRASLTEMEALHGLKTISKPIRAKEERNGQPIAKPGSSHAILAQC